MRELPVPIRTVIVVFVVLTSLVLTTDGRAADTFKTYVKQGDYDDVRFELTEAIVARGLKLDLNGHVADMLKRTGADLGDSTPIYKQGEYFLFCSAKLSRDMMAVDPAFIGFCPFTLFLYETSAKPGEIVVGYRRFPDVKSEAARKALGAVDALLDGVARQAIE